MKNKKNIKNINQNTTDVKNINIFTENIESVPLYNKKEIFPSVVSAWKSGAVSPNLNDAIMYLLN